MKTGIECTEKTRVEKKNLTMTFRRKNKLINRNNNNNNIYVYIRKKKQMSNNIGNEID